LADIERGIWSPPEHVQAPAEVRVPSFHEFSARWWTLTQREWSEATRADYRWRLEEHLLPHFASLRLDEITGGSVKEYVAAKLAEGDRIRHALERGKPLTKRYTDRHGRECERPLRPLSPRSINMTVTLLGAILAAAQDDDELGPLIPRNAARGRRIRERAPARTYLDGAAQLAALLDAAGELDRRAPAARKHVHRRATLATLTFAGLRIGELLALRWRDVDLAGGWLHVGESKTDAGRRKVKVRGALRDELLALRSGVKVNADAYVFATATGRRMARTTSATECSRLPSSAPMRSSRRQESRRCRA
jgi:integrase